MPSFRSKNASIGTGRRPRKTTNNLSSRDTLNRRVALRNAGERDVLPRELDPSKIIPKTIEGKKEFFAKWVEENKIPGKIQAWFSCDTLPEFYDWRILNEDDGSHRLLKIEPPQKGVPTPEIVLAIHEQIRKEHLKAFRSSLSQIWFRPTGDGRYGLLIQANLHGVNSAKGYKSFLEFLQRNMFDKVICCHQIECRPALYFNPAHPPMSVMVEIRNGFGPQYVPIANSDYEYHILERLPRNKSVYVNLPEKIKSVIHPNENDSLLEFNTGAGFIGNALAGSFKHVELAEAHSYGSTAAIDAVHHLMNRNVKVNRTGIDAEWIKKFFEKPDNAGTWTIIFHPQDGAPLPAGVTSAIAEAKPARILLISENLERAASEIRKFRSEGYMLRKVVPLDLEPEIGTFSVLFYFVPDRAGVLGNPALQAAKSKAIRPRERKMGAPKQEKPTFEADSPRFVQRKRNATK